MYTLVSYVNMVTVSPWLLLWLQLLPWKQMLLPYTTIDAGTLDNTYILYYIIINFVIDRVAQ